MEPIKVRLNFYSLDTSNKENIQRYQTIKTDCLALGYKLFDHAAEPKSYQHYENLKNHLEQTIETDFLFSNQYNTAEGFRIFDWTELINFDNRKFKHGYYLTGDIEALNKAKTEQYCCGYCGKRYHKPEQKFCSACIDNQYLEKSQLHLLLLLPLSAGAFPNRAELVATEPKLIEAWNQAQAELPAKLQAAHLVRLQKDADRLEKNASNSIHTINYETKIKCLLLRAGIDDENLIYYSHTNRWCFGWRKKPTDQEVEIFQAAVQKHCPSILPILEYTEPRT